MKLKKPKPPIISSPKRGDRVLMLQARYWHCFCHLKLPIWGRIVRTNGGYYYVKPLLRGRNPYRAFELYDNEIAKCPSESLLAKVGVRRKKDWKIITWYGLNWSEPRRLVNGVWVKTKTA